MINELGSIFRLISRFLPDDDIIIFGDFNMPNIIWTLHDDNPGCLTAIRTKYRYEEKFIELLSTYCLKQINHIENQHNKLLDLIIATDITITNLAVYEATGAQLLDRVTQHHPAYIVDMTYMSLPTALVYSDS